MKNRSRDRDDPGLVVSRRHQRALFDRRDIGNAVAGRQRIQASRFLLAGCALLLLFAGRQELLNAGSNPDRLVAGRFGSTTFQSCRAAPFMDPGGPPTFDPKTLQPIGRFVTETGTLHGTLRFHGDGTGTASLRASSMRVSPNPEGFLGPKDPEGPGNMPLTGDLPDPDDPEGPRPEPQFPRQLECELIYEVRPNGGLVVHFACKLDRPPSVLAFSDVGQISLDRQTLVLTSIGRTIEETLDPEGSLIHQRICHRSTTAVRMGRMGPEPEGCIENGDCGSGEFCLRPPRRCGGRGECRPRPEVCTAQFDPVCGCNGETYSNACQAAAAGVSIARNGSCAGP